MKVESSYRGRFAPSPTGSLHFGSLAAAVASYLDARHAGGEWLLRIEDIDQPRSRAGALSTILKTLEIFGFEWDGPICYQSKRLEFYIAAYKRLCQLGLLYACNCSRSHITTTATIIGHEGPVYPGTCRHRLLQDIESFTTRTAVRLVTDNTIIKFKDCIYGNQQQMVESQVGDFVLRRADRLFTYQLAVTVDDAEQGITQVVRGADLLFSTPRQIYLQRLLDYPTPGYAHIPLVLDHSGRKLSKSDADLSVNVRQPVATLNQVLHFLGQEEIHATSLDAFWRQAITTWSIERVPPTALPG